jgi:cytochrome c-type biogenesis protein CcmH/NrfG
VAGTSAGAAIGSTLEEQDQIARTQDEAIERHERTIQAQRSELIELRRMNQDDSAGERRSASLRAAFAPSLDLKPKQELGSRDLNANMAQGIMQRAETSVQAPSMAAKLPRPESVGSRWDVAPSQTTNTNSVQASSAAEPAALDQCGKADQEIQKSEDVSDSADKLFHLRRAIRLCPEQPRYRMALGDYYAANNRTTDAKAEYERANKLAPDTVVVSERLKQFSNY